MATLTRTAAGSDQGRVGSGPGRAEDQAAAGPYANALELGRVALENGLPALKRELAAATGAQSAGRIGARQGRISELTGIFPVKGGAKRLRGLLQLLEGNFQGADAVGTVHDMRFVFPGQRNEAALRHRLRWRVGRLHRRLRDEDSQRSGSAVLQCRGVAGIRSPKRKTGSSSTRSRRRPGTSPVQTWRWRRPDGLSASERRWTNSSTRSANKDSEANHIRGWDSSVGYYPFLTL
jgi:hypothetical protein